MGRLAVPEPQFEPQIQESKFPKVFSANRLKLLATALLSLRLLCELMLSEGAVRGIGMIGAMAGPLFMFVAAESFRNTANHGRYLLRFLPASWVTGFLSLVLTSIFDEGREVLRTNNYFGTVFVLGIYILAWENLREGLRLESAKRVVRALLLAVIPLLNLIFILLAIGGEAETTRENIYLWLIAGLFSLIPSLILVNSGPVLVLIGLMYYIFPHRGRILFGVFLCVGAMLAIFSESAEGIIGLAAVPIALYNGERGRNMEIFFYVGYPLLVLLLFLIVKWMPL